MHDGCQHAILPCSLRMHCPALLDSAMAQTSYGLFPFAACSQNFIRIALLANNFVKAAARSFPERTTRIFEASKAVVQDRAGEEV